MQMPVPAQGRLIGFDRGAADRIHHHGDFVTLVPAQPMLSSLYTSAFAILSP
jgi:hypothetical protein